MTNGEQPAITSVSQPSPFAPAIDLAQPRLGTRVVFATDDFFADKSRLIDPADPVFIPGKYDDHGKWMDGWESRRKRIPGHDFCIVRIGVPGVIRGVDIDTRHFTGNFAPAVSLEACVCDSDVPADDMQWQPLLAEQTLQGDRQHFFPIDSDTPFTHIRLNIFPDGGVARLRLYGDIHPNWATLAKSAPVDLFAIENGGRALACNDEHYGTMRNLNAPGRGVNMGDGWETARRRVPGNDWVVLALGTLGTIERIEVDTAHFKGNYPDRAMFQAARLDTVADDTDWSAISASWPELMPEQKLSADAQHLFADEVNALGPVTHVRMNIYPDGGVSRVRLFGTPVLQGK
ncbi:MAG: allantoicase [Pseudomonadota bacterium]